jgi:hypothetical protein
LFQIYSSHLYWKFVYNVTDLTSEANKIQNSLNFIMNQPPSSGVCDIDQTNGIGMVTKFTINCSNWQDIDGISKYALFSNICLYFNQNLINPLIFNN